MPNLSTAFGIGLMVGIAVFTGLGTLMATDEHRASLLLISAAAFAVAAVLIFWELFDKLSRLIRINQQIRDELTRE